MARLWPRCWQLTAPGRQCIQHVRCGAGQLSSGHPASNPNVAWHGLLVLPAESVARSHLRCGTVLCHRVCSAPKGCPTAPLRNEPSCPGSCLVGAFAPDSEDGRETDTCPAARGFPGRRAVGIAGIPAPSPSPGCVSVDLSVGGSAHS